MPNGFEGKQCIHPAQLEIANCVYSPSEEQADRARTVTTAAKDPKDSGQDVVDLNGKMVDAANMRLAQANGKPHKLMPEEK